MKKLLPALLLFLFMNFLVVAQEAPDFEGTDTHGNVHQLYADYLDNGITVVLDLFFVDCPPCNELAPQMQPLYEMYGSGNADVQFLSISSNPADNDSYINGFEDMHGTTWPSIGPDGGGAEIEAVYTNGDYGEFFGYPTLVVIAPDRSVTYDVWGSSIPETVELLDAAVADTGATGEVAVAAPTATYDYEVMDGTVTFTDSSTDAESWMWDFGNGETSDEQNPTVTFMESGDYTICLTVTNEGGTDEICNEISVVVENTSVGNLISAGMEVYPNPADQVLNLNFELDKTDQLSIEVTDLSGKVLNQVANGLFIQGQHQIEIPLDNLSSGLYLVEIETPSLKGTAKFFVK